MTHQDRLAKADHDGRIGATQFIHGDEDQELRAKLVQLDAATLIVERIPTDQQAAVFAEALRIAKNGHHQDPQGSMVAGIIYGFTLGHDYAATYGPLAPVEFPIENGPRCRVCSCTDEYGCDEGCAWVEPNLCSSCVGAPET
jgi:hypothetical protein